MPRSHFPNDQTVAQSAAVQRLGAAAARVRSAIAACPRYAVTGLHRLSGLAGAWGLGEIWVKDERDRLGLGSFKALGGAYAVLLLSRSIAVAAGRADCSIAGLLAQPHPALGRTTFAAATSGNHGRSVAAGARLVGARCVVFAKQDAPPRQLRAIADLGAEIVRVSGSYDDAVDACRRACAEHGWVAVPDTADDPNDDVVAHVMEGYTLIAAELVERLPRRPSHVVVQAGVGGLAAAVAGHLVAVNGQAAPRVIVAEPDAAACLQASAMAGRPVSLPRSSSSTMGRLDCYAPSLPAWSVLQSIVAAYVSVSDAQADDACRVLAERRLHTTPSGAAGLAALAQLATSPDARARLELTPHSDVVVFVTEAALSDAPSA